MAHRPAIRETGGLGLAFSCCIAQYEAMTEHDPHPTILMILTSHDRLGDTGRPTGAWLEEVAAPWYRFRDAGYAVELVSPIGGPAPIDPASLTDATTTDATRRFLADDQAQRALGDTRPLDDVEPGEGVALFYPGGHGPLWDLAEDAHSIALIEAAVAAGRPVGAVCHGPAALAHATGTDGRPLVAGRRVTGFTDTEEASVGLSEVVPFSIEQVFLALGARFDRAADFASHVVADRGLVTGQNPASSDAAGAALIELLQPGDHPRADLRPLAADTRS